MKRICILATVLFVSAAFISKTNAQNVIAGIDPDNQIASTANVKNTGNDIRYYENYNGTMYIMTWDGDDPGFGWYESENGTTGDYPIKGTEKGTVSDPDIVLFEDGGIMFTLILYLLEDSVYYECWEFDNSNSIWTNNIKPTYIDGPDCTCPNVDVGEYGATAIVWENNSEIYTTIGDINGNFNATYEYIDDGHYPDVAHGAEIGNNYVYYCYLNDGKDELWNSYALYNNILLNISNSFTNIYVYGISSSYEFSKPRIACPVSESTGCPSYLNIVSIINNNSGTNLTYICKQNYLNQINSNTTESIYPAPVISYSGDYLATSWVNDKYIISRMLYSCYGTFDTYSPTNVYSQVNEYSNSKEFKYPSLSGRFGSDQKLFTYYNLTDESINYKFNNSPTTQLKLKEETSEIKLYPNPTSSSIFLELDNHDTSIDIELYNIQGQKLYSAKFNDNIFMMNMEKYTKGVYYLRIHRENETITKTFVVQ